MNRREFLRTGMLLGLSNASLPGTIAFEALPENKLFEKLGGIRSVYDLVDVARRQAMITPNSLWIRGLFRMAIILASAAQEYEYAGDAIGRSLSDSDWGRQVMRVAIEKSDCAEDLTSIAYTLAKHDGFSDFAWAYGVFTSAVGKAQSVAELIDVAYTMCWADGFLPHAKMMFLEMTTRVKLPAHLAGIPQQICLYDFERASWAGKALREFSPESISPTPPLCRNKIVSFLLKINLV